MTLKAIKYQTGYVFVDEQADIEEESYVYRAKDKKIYLALYTEEIPYKQRGNVKLVAQTPDLSLPVPCVELEEEFDFDTELTKLSTTDRYYGGGKGYRFSEGDLWDMVNRAVKAAQAKKYSKADLEQAWIEGVRSEWINVHKEGGFHSFKEYFQSLQPQVESIELEMIPKEYLNYCGLDSMTERPDVPVAYQKDGRTYMKVKSITYKTKQS